jgi:hypothetical protein
MFARRAAVVLLFSSLASFSAGGCGWISGLGVPQEIRDKGLLAALEKPMPLDQPFDGSYYLGHAIEHPAEMRALLDRMEEFAEGLEDPALRAAYAKSLAAGERSRTEAFDYFYLNQSGGLAESEKQYALWERIDDALAEGSEPELVEERLIALAVFVRHADPGAAARLTQAIRDGWNPASEKWPSVFSSIENPADLLWTDAWAAAARSDLDNALGKAILDRLSELHTPPAIHPFATPQGTATLVETMRQAQEPREFYVILGQFDLLDDETGKALWQAAKGRPDGLVRVEAAFLWFRRSGSQDALEVLKEAAGDERYAIAALNGLSRLGRIEDVPLPTGEALARAKAYQALSLYYGFLDAEAAQTTLTPMLSGRAKFEGDEMEVALFRYAMSAPAASPETEGATSDGLVIVDERLSLMPDETRPPEVAASADPYGQVPVAPLSATESMAEEDRSSLDLVCDRIKLDALHDEGCVTALDLLAAFHPNSRRAGMHDLFEVYGRYDELKQRMLDSDERWKSFDVPLEDLGFAFEPKADRVKNETLPVDDTR